jgi:inosine/xanthosine triphosphate pyrophosphatase family protein
MGSAFSRAQAANGLKNANTATLRSALTNYINATKNMNANAIRAALNTKRIGLTESYKNRIANGVANAVAASRGAKVAVAAANAGVTPETATAVVVNNAVNKLKNLNALMNSLTNEAPNRKIVLYQNRRRNLNANRVLNAGRNGGAKYATFFNSVASASPNGKNITFGGTVRNSNTNTGINLTAEAGKRNVNAVNVNRKFINTLLARKNLNTNNKKIEAMLAYNPKIKFYNLRKPTNTAQIEAFLQAANNAANTKYGKNRKVNVGEALNQGNLSGLFNENKAVVNKKAANAEKNKQISEILAEINTAGNNVGKLRNIKNRLNKAGFKRNSVSTSNLSKYNSLNSRVIVANALNKANALNLSKATNANVSNIMKSLVAAQSRANNKTKATIANKIKNISEKRRLLKKN